MGAYSTGDKVRSSPAVLDDGTVVVGSDDGKVHFINPDDFSTKHTFQTEGLVRSPPAVMKNGTIVIGSHDGKVYFLYPDGRLKASFETGSIIDASPTVLDDGTVVIGSRNGNIYFLKLSETSHIFNEAVQVPFTEKSGSAGSRDAPRSEIN